MRVRVVMTVTVIVVLEAKNEHADPIHHQPQHGHDNGLVENDGHRIQQPHHAFEGHEHRKQRQQQCAGEATQRIDLAGAEAELMVAGIFSGVDIGKRRNAEGGGVRGHVQAVGQQGHGAEADAGNQLDDHHHGGDGDHDQGARLARPSPVLRKGVVVLPRLGVMKVHVGGSGGVRGAACAGRRCGCGNGLSFWRIRSLRRGLFHPAQPSIQARLPSGSPLTSRRTQAWRPLMSAQP